MNILLHNNCTRILWHLQVWSSRNFSFLHKPVNISSTRENHPIATVAWRIIWSVEHQITFSSFKTENSKHKVLTVSVTIDDTSLANEALLMFSKFVIVSHPMKMLSKAFSYHLFSMLKQHFKRSNQMMTDTISGRIIIQRYNI